MSLKLDGKKLSLEIEERLNPKEQNNNKQNSNSNINAFCRIRT